MCFICVLFGSIFAEQTEQSASHIDVCISVSWNTDEDVSGAGKELCDFRLMRLSIDPVGAGKDRLL